MVEEKIMLGSPVTPARLMVICRSALTFIFIIATSPEAPVEGANWIFGDGIFRAILFRESRTRFVLATGSLMKTVGAGSVFDDQGPMAPSCSSPLDRPPLPLCSLAVNAVAVRF